MINVSACGIIDMDSPNATTMRAKFSKIKGNKREQHFGEKKNKKSETHLR
jgi:hypothetical protein